MAKKPTYEELEQRAKELEEEAVKRKRTEEALRESEEKYRNILESIEEGYYEVDLAGNFTFFNDSMCKMIGYSKDEMTGMNNRQFMDEKNAKKVFQTFNNIYRTEKPTKAFDWKLIRKDGSDCFVETSVSLIRDSEGQPLGFRGIARDVSQRKEMEEALQESEAKYRDIFENSTDFVYTLDLEGNFTDVNKAAEHLTGYKKAELTKMNFRDFTSKDVHEEIFQAFHRVFETGEPLQDFPLEVTVKGGIRKQFETSAVPLRKGQKIVGFQGSSRDITDRVNAEKALLESEERYRSILESIEESYFEVDIAGNFTFFNDSLSKSLGYSNDELLGMNNLDYMSSESAKKIYNLFNQIYRTGTPIKKVIYEIIRKDGSRGFHELSSSLMKDRAGQPIGFRGIAHDITDFKKVGDALQESKDNLDKAQKIAHIGNWSRDLKLNQAQWSDEMYRIFGLTPRDPAEISSETFLSRIHPGDRERVTSELREAAEKKQAFDFEYRTVPIEGSEKIIRARGEVEYDETGTPVRLFGTNQDITAQKRLEAQLQQAQKMEAMGTLAGGIAHDFNNLLMAIQGRTSIMLMNKDSSHPDFGHLRGIEGHVESAADLTRQLLGFARGGKYEVRPTDINEFIKKQNRMFGRTKKEITIRAKYEENLWPVEVDRGQIEQVLLNLYVNAWQAMPGGGDLYLETENVTLDENYVKPFSIEPGNYVKISITDTGVGMDKATQERIFDPFFTTKEMGRGTGLGLASAYGIIKNHGGFINVYSEKGEGTTFNIYLPASEKEVTEERELSKSVLKGSETVLLIDDEDMIIEVGVPILEKMGYKVFIARSGKEAIKVYEENKDQIDMVILDMIMPDMSGGETYDRMKEIDPDIKVLLSSGYSINGQATEILDRGCNGFIQKPFKMKELSQKLREILDS